MGEASACPASERPGARRTNEPTLEPTDGSESNEDMNERTEDGRRRRCEQRRKGKKCAMNAVRTGRSGGAIDLATERVKDRRNENWRTGAVEGRTEGRDGG